MAQAIIQTSGSTKPTLQEQDSLFVVKRNGFDDWFSKKSGLLKSVQTGKRCYSIQQWTNCQEGSTNFKILPTSF